MEEFESEVERIFTRWLNRTEELYRQELARMKVGDSGDLERSVGQHFRKLAGDYLEGGMLFEKYGRYVDMGSGRGYSFGKSTRSNFDAEGRRRKAGRKKKPFHGRVFYARINDLQGAVGFEMMEASVTLAKKSLKGV